MCQDGHLSLRHRKVMTCLKPVWPKCHGLTVMLHGLGYISCVVEHKTKIVVRLGIRRVQVDGRLVGALSFLVSTEILQASR